MAQGYSGVRFIRTKGAPIWPEYNKLTGVIEGAAPGQNTRPLNFADMNLTGAALIAQISKAVFDGVDAATTESPFSLFHLIKNDNDSIISPAGRLREGQLYTLVYNSPDGEYNEKIRNFLKNHPSSQYKIVEDTAFQTTSDRSEVVMKERHLKLGGAMSPRPLESLYMYSMNTNKMIPTIRTGGATYLPSGEGVTAYEVGITFIGRNEINTILRRWISSIHHSPILEIVQDDIKLLASQPSPHTTVARARNNNNSNERKLARTFREAKNLVQDYAFVQTIQDMITQSFGAIEHSNAIRAASEVTQQLKTIFSESSSVVDITRTHRLTELTEVLRVLNDVMPSSPITDLINEIVGTSVNLFDIFKDVAEIEAAIKSEDSETNEPDHIATPDRVMVAVQSYNITTLPENPLALHFSATFMRINHHTIMPHFRYKSTSGSPVDTVEESAFYDWVGRSLYNDSGFTPGKFLSKYVPDFYFSRYTSHETYDPTTITDATLPVAVSKIYMPTTGDIDLDEAGNYSEHNVYHSDSYTIDLNSEDTATRSIQLRASFDFTPVQVESSMLPTYQFLGLSSVDCVVNLATKNRNVIRQLTSMPENIAALAKKERVRKPYLLIENDILNMSDFRACLPQSVQVVPDEETIDTWNVNIQLVKYSNRDVRELQGGFKRANRITNEDYTSAFKQIVHSDQSGLHRLAVVSLMDSIYYNRNADYPDKVKSFMTRVDESAIGTMLEALGIFEGNDGQENTLVDLKTFWQRSGIWLGDRIKDPITRADIPAVSGDAAGRVLVNVNSVKQCLDSAIHNLTSFDRITNSYDVAPQSIPSKTLLGDIPFTGAVAGGIIGATNPTGGQPGDTLAALLDLFGGPDIRDNRINFANLVNRDSHLPLTINIINDPEFSINAFAPSDIPSKYKDALYSNSKALAMLTVSQESEFYDDQVAELFGEFGTAFKIEVGRETIGYYEMMNRTLFEDVRALWAEIDRSQQTESLGEKLTLTEKIKLNNRSITVGKDRVPQITDQVLYAIPRLASILNHFILNNFDPDIFSTDTILDKNVNTYPDLRLPQYIQYIGFLTETDAANGKTHSSYMSPDWYFDYSEYSSAVEGMYQSFKSNLHSNINFNKQLLANRYSEHIGEEESTEVSLSFPVDQVILDSIQSVGYPYMPVPTGTVNNSLLSLGAKPRQSLSNTGSQVFTPIRVRGLWSNTKTHGLREIEKLESKIAAFNNLQEGSALDIRLQQAKIEIAEKRNILENLGTTDAEFYEDNLWRDQLVLMYSKYAEAGQEVTVTMPLASLSYIDEDDTFSNLVCNWEEIRQSMIDADIEGVISFEPEGDPLYNPFSEEEIDTTVGGSFLSQAYGNTPLMKDADNPNLNQAFFREDKLGSRETLEAHRQLAELDEKKTDAIGFKTLYPTYYCLFYQEDGLEITQVYNFYKAAGLTNIGVHHDRNNPISIATISLSNPFNALFSRYSDESLDVNLSQNESKPPLIVGMGVQIKLGYDANSSTLQTVFTGQITDIRYGMETEIVAQSWGFELTNQNGSQGFYDANVHNSPVRASLAYQGAKAGALYGGGRLGLKYGPSVIKYLGTTRAIQKIPGIVQVSKHTGTVLTAIKGAKIASLASGNIAGFFISIALGWAIGKGIEAVLSRLHDLTVGQKSPNAPYRMLEKSTYMIEQHLGSQIMTDLRIRHFQTPLYLGAEHISPKTQNFYFPTTPELWEGTVDLILASQDKQRSESQTATFSGRKEKSGGKLLKDRLTIRSTSLRGREFDFLFKNMTAWEAMSEFTRRYPQLTIACRPFDFRATLFIGRPDRLYRFTERRDSAWADWVRTNSAAGQDYTNLSKLRTRLNEEKHNFFLDIMTFILGNTPDFSKSSLDERRSSTQKRLTNFDNEVNEFDNERRLIRIPYVGDPAWAIDWSVQLYGRLMGLGRGTGGFEGAAARVRLLQSYIDFKQSSPGGDFGGDKVLASGVKWFGLNSENNIAEILKGLDAVYESWLATQKMTALLSEQVNTHPHMRPFRRYHLASSVASFQNIVSNQIVATDEFIYNQVTMGVMNEFTDVGNDGIDTPKNWNYVEIVADPTIAPAERRIINLQCRTTSDTETAISIGTSALKSFMSNMYRGQLTQLGNPNAFPHDRVVLADDYNEMAGAFDASKVTHVFNRNDGFVTSFEPAAIVYAKDYLGPIDFWSGKARKQCLFWGKIFAAGTFGSYKLLGGAAKALTTIGSGAAATTLFSVSNNDFLNEVRSVWTGEDATENIAPLIVSPMIHKNEVMLAGMNGFRWDLGLGKLSENSLLRRFDDYIKVAGTGVQEFWSDRQGFHLEGFANSSEAAVRRRSRLQARVSLFKARSIRNYQFSKVWGVDNN